MIRYPTTCGSLCCQSFGWLDVNKASKQGAGLSAQSAKEVVAMMLTQTDYGSGQGMNGEIALLFDYVIQTLLIW